MGLFDSITGSSTSGSKIARRGMREGYFNPYNIGGSFGTIGSTPGYIPTKKEWKRGMRPTPGTFTGSLSPEMEALRKGFLGSAMGALGGQENDVAGFLGISPEMFAEFLASNNNMGQEFMDASRGYLAEEQAMGPYDFDKTYAERLANMRALDAPLEERERLGSLQSQFGKGILASTAGSYQTEGLERALAAKDMMRQDRSFDQALGLGDQYAGIRQMLQNAGFNFGNAGSGFTGDRFNRALQMFGAGHEAENMRTGRAGGFLSGIGSIDQFLANLMQMSSNMGAQRSGAIQGAYAPLIQAYMQKDQNQFNMGGQLLAQAHDAAMTSMEQFGNFGFGMATGGITQPGQPQLVGEHGPEIIMPTGYDQVIPNPNTMNLANRMGMTIAPSGVPGVPNRPVPFKGGMPSRNPRMGGRGYMPLPFDPMEGFRSGRGKLSSIFESNNRYR